MNRTRTRLVWFASIVTTSLMALLVLSPVGTLAKPPGWGFDYVNAVPGAVSPGKAVAFDVKISNTGKSNISSVLMKTDLGELNPLAVPLYVSDATWTGQPEPLITRPCGSPDYTTELSCDFGSLVAGATVSLRIAFPTPSTLPPSSPYTFNFVLTGNGNTPSDTGGTSHGDTKKGLASVNLNTSSDFAGGFVLANTESFETGTSLSRQNPQSTKITISQDYEAGTIQEQSSFSDGGLCQTVTCIGQWAVVTAPNPSNALISGSLLIYGKNIPGSVTANDIFLYHLGGTDAERGDDGIIGDESSERCASADDSASAPCIYVTPEGQNWRVDFWLIHNGGLRGGY